MADLHKYTSKEVLNKVLYNNTSLNTYALSEGLNTVLDSANDRLKIRLEGGTVDGSLTVTGGLTVEGATTTIESQTITVADKTFELAVPSSGSATDATSDGGGLILKGTTDKTILWSNANDRWDFNQGIGLGSNSLSAGATTVDSLSVSDGNITNVGDISLDSISSDAGTSINVVLGSDAGDDFTVDTSKLVVEGDTGNVGIGTTSPEGKLSITKGNELGLLSIREASNLYGFDLGLDPSTGDGVWRRIVNDVKTEAFRVQRSSGNVGIGTASPSTSLMVQNGTSEPEISLFHDSGSNQGIGRLVLYTDGSGAKETVAHIELRQESGGGSSRKGEIAFAVGDNGAPAVGAWFDNNCNLNFANGKGIGFAAKTPDGTSMSSELLNDYEEGTWTPTMVQTSASSIVYNGGNGGGYTKIGRLVHLTAEVHIDTYSSGRRTITIGGIPFANAVKRAQGQISLADGFTFADPDDASQMTVELSGSSLWISESYTSGRADWSHSNLSTSGWRFWFAISYMTAT